MTSQFVREIFYDCCRDWYCYHKDEIEQKKCKTVGELEDHIDELFDYDMFFDIFNKIVLAKTKDSRFCEIIITEYGVSKFIQKFAQTTTDRIAADCYAFGNLNLAVAYAVVEMLDLGKTDAVIDIMNYHIERTNHEGLQEE